MALTQTCRGLVELTANFMESSSKEVEKQSLGKISEVISTKEAAGILGLVEVLGVYLTSGEVQQRRKASRLLAELMHRLEPNFLSDKESELMAVFFIDRLKDHHSIQPQVIYGLLGLISYFSVTDQNIMSICQTLFAEVHIRSLVQADRRNVFNMFSNMLEKYFRPIHRMGSDFVLGFIQSMDGEKDPRNLLVCFQNVQEIISKLPFEVFAEDLFEVTSCYFPIDFTPPSSDPYGISKEDLVVQLRKCLSSTHLFAPFCMPLLLEKITSDIIDAKIDAYLTLSACTTNYKPDDFKDYYKDLWNAVRGDYLLGGILAIESACMHALEGVGVCLSNRLEICKDYVDLVLHDCEQALKDPDLNLHCQLGKIVVAVVFSCASVFQIAFPRITKFLGSLITDIESNISSTAMVEILHKLLQHPFLMKQKLTSLSSLFVSKQNMVTYLLNSLSSSDCSVSMICCSFECLLVLLFHESLSESEASIFFNSLFGRLNSATEERILQTLFKCVSFICERDLEPAPQYVCNSLLVSIEDEVLGKNSGNTADVIKLKNNLEALSLTLENTHLAVSVANKLIENFLINYLECTHVQLLNFLLQVTENFPLAADGLEGKLIPMLLQVIEMRKMSIEIWDLINVLLRTIISNLSPRLQSVWISKLVSRFILEKEHLHEESLLVVKKSNFVSSFLCTARGPIDLSISQDVVGWLQQEVLDATDPLSIEYMCKSYASLINKMPEGEMLQHSLDGACTFVDKVLSAENISVEMKERSVTVLLWIAKAVVLRWNDHAPLFLTKLMSMIHCETIGRHICEHMYILVKEHDDCLNVKMHAKRRIMYKQRLIDFVLPKLVELHRNGNEVTKSSISKAISCIFQHLPKQIVQKQLLPLIPLLIHSLSMPDVSVLHSTLSTFNSLDNPAILKNYVTSLIPRLLSLARAPESMNLRMQSISCLKILAGLPVHNVYPYQKNVIRSLKNCLDDKKRLVRREAYRCRNSWYLLSQD